MPAIIQYLLKLSVSAAVIYAFYYLVLRRLTFYNLNRWYLSGYTLLCFIIPFINIAQIANKADEKMPALTYIPVVQNIKNYMPAALNETEHHSYNIWDAIMIVLAIGSVILLVKLAVQMISVMNMKGKAKLISDKDSAIYHVDEDIMPFSFGKSIYLNKNMHSDKELGEIIMHEYVHVKQLHSADILIAELFCVVNWFNPFAWSIRHSIRQNLEFIADDNVVRSGINKKAYQYHLLKVVGIPQYRIANQFNFSSLKKRIIMMNRAKSAKIHLLKFMFILPLLAVTLMAFRSDIINTVNKITAKPAVVKSMNISPQPANIDHINPFKKAVVAPSISDNLKRPDTAVKKSMGVTAYYDGEVLKAKAVDDGSYIIITRNGDRVDTYSNLTYADVKKGDKIKKGQPIGTVDVDPVTGTPKLKYQMYNGTVVVYDADGSDTSKKGYNISYRSYGDVYVAHPSKNGSYSVASSGNNRAYVIRDKGGKKSGSSQVFIAYSDNGRRDSIKLVENKTMVLSPDRVYHDPADEIRFTIDSRHIDEQEIARMEKQFADNGFKLKINNHQDSSDARLSIQVSGAKDNSSSSASASFSRSDLHKNNSLIRVTGDKKTGEVSIETLPSDR